MIIICAIKLRPSFSTFSLSKFHPGKCRKSCTMINKVISTHPYLKHKDKTNYKKMHAVFTGVSQRTVVEIEDPADSCEEACAISTDDEHPDCAEETVSRVFPSTSRSTSHGCKSTCCQVLEQNSPFQPTDKHVLKSTKRKQGSRHRFFFHLTGTKLSHGWRFVQHEAKYFVGTAPTWASVPVVLPSCRKGRKMFSRRPVLIIGRRHRKNSPRTVSQICTVKRWRNGSTESRLGSTISWKMHADPSSCIAARY